MKKLLIPLAVLVAIPTVLVSVALGANWITTCNTSHANNDDPIVFPGQPGASHRHVYVGARNTNASSTPSSLRAGGTTCGMSGDTSAYWVPQALKYNLGTSKHALFYYKGDANTRPFPDGLKIIVGNSKATSPSQNAGIASGRIKFKCGPGSGTETAAPPAQCGSGVMVPVVEFPNCWNGRDLDSGDHISHMAYGGGKCPKSHPVPLPRIKAYIRYSVGKGPIDFSLASGPWYTFHIDFFNAWVPSELQRFVDQCIKTGRNCSTNPS